MVDCMAYGFGGLTGPPWNKLGENADFLVAYDTIGRHFKYTSNRFTIDMVVIPTSKSGVCRYGSAQPSLTTYP